MPQLCFCSHFHGISFCITSLSVWLWPYMKSVSHRWHIDGSCWFLFFQPSCLFMGEFSRFIFKVIDRYLLLPFCSLFSGCLVVPLFLSSFDLFIVQWLSLVLCSDLFLSLLCIYYRFSLWLPWKCKSLSKSPGKGKQRRKITSQNTLPSFLRILLCPRVHYHIASTMYKKCLTQEALDCYFIKTCMQD